MLDATNEFTSVVDPTQTLHNVRSHRRPKKVRRYRFIAAALVALAGVSLLQGAPVVPSAIASAESAVQAAPVALAERGSTVDRSKRAVPTRTQQINKVINYALAQRGDRYRFGAAGPNKWDCSGLAMVAYRQIGVRLPHSTHLMLRRGKHISRSHLQRGDLVFPSNHHVGIYIGHGYMIVASSGHGHVMIQKVYAFYAARRII